MTAPPIGGDRCEALRDQVTSTLSLYVGDELPEAVDAVLALDAVRDALAAQEEAEQRGYERGRRDFQFQPSGDNHHNAALCPYCSPRGDR